jgi:hypothetical protein
MITRRQCFCERDGVCANLMILFLMCQALQRRSRSESPFEFDSKISGQSDAENLKDSSLAKIYLCLHTHTHMCVCALLGVCIFLQKVLMPFIFLVELDNKNVLKLFTCEYDLCSYVFI